LGFSFSAAKICLILVRIFVSDRLTGIMKDSTHILAILLAGEEHPQLREEADFQAASDAVAASSELQKKFAESKAFLDAHHVLIQIEGLPEECRARIAQMLKTEMAKNPQGKIIATNPWALSKYFAWAAALVFLLAGIAMISSNIMRQQDQAGQEIADAELTPEAAFLQFVGTMAGQGRAPLQHRNSQSTQLVYWLGEQGAPSFSAPQPLMAKATMGCAYLEGPDGKISLICFDTDSGVIHLFVTPSKTLQLEGRSSPKAMILNDRNALKWHDEKNAYLLIGHEENQQLPEVFL
jgi:hypothetical protein